MRLLHEEAFLKWTVCVLTYGLEGVRTGSVCSSFLFWEHTGDAALPGRVHGPGFLFWERTGERSPAREGARVLASCFGRTEEA